MDTAKDDDTPIDPGPYSPALGDWRTAMATWVLKLGDQPVTEPTAAHQVSIFVAPEGTTSFRTPSASALHMNSAWKAARRAHAVRELVEWDRRPPPFAGLGMAAPARNTVREASVEDLFDYFEEAMSCSMSSYAAIEAFCNVTLVDHVPGPVPVKPKKQSEHMTAEQMERSLSTDEKLRQHVPDALKIRTLAGLAIWDRYLWLKSIRDSVTHFKRKDQARRFEAVSEPTALHELWALDPFKLPEVALELIRHFHPVNPPRWLQKLRFQAAPTPLVRPIRYSTMAWLP